MSTLARILVVDDASRNRECIRVQFIESRSTSSEGNAASKLRAQGEAFEP